MKHLILFLILFNLCLFGILGETVSIGFFDGFPTNYRDPETGEPSGSTINFLRDFLAEMRYEVEFVGPYPFPRLLSMLKNGEIDSLLGFSFVEERLEFVYYPNRPYRIDIPYIFFLKDHPVSYIQAVEDIIEYRYSYRSGGALPEFLRSFENLLDITYLSRDTWITQSLQMLELGRIDGIITSTDASIIYEARRLGMYDQIKQVIIPGRVDPIYLGISKASEKGRRLLEDYNTNLTVSKLRIEDYDHPE